MNLEASPRPAPPEIKYIVALNQLFYDIKKLNGDVIHGDERKEYPLNQAISEESSIVLDVLSETNNLPGINITNDENFLNLSWESIRGDSRSESRRYMLSTLEKTLALDLRRYEKGRIAYEEDEKNDFLGTNGKEYFEALKIKRKKRIDLTIQMNHAGMLSQVRIERTRRKITITALSENPHFEPVDINVNLKDLDPEIRKLIPKMPAKTT